MLVDRTIQIPLVFANSGDCLCIDFRKVNELTKWDSHCACCMLIKTAFSNCLMVQAVLPSLTRGPGRLLPSDLAPILQYGSRPPSDFLAKILGVDNSPFVWNTRFYFTRSYL
jgi:hypothetical protein